jgi:hypothetical protein
MKSRTAHSRSVTGKDPRHDISPPFVGHGRELSQYLFDEGDIHFSRGGLIPIGNGTRIDRGRGTLASFLSSEGSDAIDGAKSRFAAGTAVFGLGPRVDAFEAEAVDAARNGGEVGGGGGAVEADGADEVSEGRVRFGRGGFWIGRRARVDEVVVRGVCFLFWEIVLWPLSISCHSIIGIQGGLTGASS